jgi:Family of unknown function (DUF6765)
MQQDFHYDMTYICAKIARLKHPELIAWAAQHVDDAVSHNTKVISFDRKHNITYAFKYPGTGQSEGSVFVSNNDDYVRQVWMTYHFLPGNFEVTGKQNYHTLRRFRGMTPAAYKKYKPKHAWSKKHLELICRPNSPTAIQLINQVRKVFHGTAWNDFPTKDKLLAHYIGVTMHVFADTWAHQDHVGAPDRAFNRVQIYGKYDSGKWNGLLWVPSDFKHGGAGKRTQFSGATLAGVNILGTSRKQDHNLWLGHGAIGCSPDHPYKGYRWTPRWSDAEIYRNNPEQFMQAFVNMVQAMRCIKNNKPFKPITDPAKYISDSTARLKDIHLNLFKNVIEVLSSKKDAKGLRQDHGVRSKLWGQSFKAIVGVVPPYKKSSEDREYKTSRKRRGLKTARYMYEDFIQSKKFLFHCAANRHFQVVHSFLSEHSNEVTKGGKYHIPLGRNEVKALLKMKRQADGLG